MKFSSFFSSLLAVLLLISAAQAVELPPFQARVWQPRGAADVEAALISDANGIVTLKGAAGKTATLKESDLGDEDLRYLTNVREAKNEFRVWKFVDLPPTMADWPREMRASFVRVVCEDHQFSTEVVEVLRDDFRRRTFPAKLLSAEDRAYAERMQAEADKAAPPLDAAPYVTKWKEYDPQADAAVLGGWKETPHFLFIWGKQVEEAAKDWNDPERRELTFRWFEKVWDYFAQRGALMPMAKSAEKTRIPVFISGTGLPKHKEGFAFGGENILMHPGALGPGSSVVGHEFTHTIQLYTGGFRDNPLVGWFWECHANWSSHQFMPDYPPALGVYTDRAHYELNSSRMNYGSWPFLQFMTEHPRFDSGFCYRIWTANHHDATGRATEDPLQTIMRLGVEEGRFHGDGVEDFGDIIGEMAAHNVTWDYVSQFAYLRDLRDMKNNQPHAGRDRAVLQAVPDRPGWWRPILSQAPRQFGINIVDLVPETAVVEANVQGIADAAEGSDWRATLVAINNKGEARYSRMARGGKISLRLRPDEKRVSLAIAATPKIYRPMEFRPGYGVKPRYPYEVAFSGARPATAPPLPPERHGEGAPHPNGGGFVEKSASVAATAYVGPNAQVLGRAKVTDAARIEDYAVVSDSAEVSGQAVIGGWARVRRNAKIGGHARVGGCAMVTDNVKLDENARVLEYAHLMGKGTFRGQSLVKGWGEVMTDAQNVIGGATVAGEDLEAHLEGSGTIENAMLYGFLTREFVEKERADNHALYARYDFAPQAGQVLSDVFGDSDGALRGAPAFVRDGAHSAIAFNGRDQYALLESHLLEAANLTFDFAVKPTGGAANQCVFAFGSADSGFSFTPKDAAGHAAFVIRKGQTAQRLSSPAPLPTNVWTRVTISISDGEGRLFLDGKLAATAPLTLLPDELRVDGGYLGRAWQNGGFFNGQLDDFAVWRKGIRDLNELAQP